MSFLFLKGYKFQNIRLCSQDCCILSMVHKVKMIASSSSQKSLLPLFWMNPCPVSKRKLELKGCGREECSELRQVKSEAVEVGKESFRGAEGHQGDWDACLGWKGRQQEVRRESLKLIRSMGSC